MIRIPILHAGRHEEFPPVETALAEPDGLLAAGGDLSSERLLDAYRHGIFPWFGEGEPILWWSPDPRMVFATDAIHVSSRMRRWLRACDWTIRADSAFASVVQACALPRPNQPSTWITQAMLDAYVRLHELGHAHSIEVYTDNELVGGIYGVAIGRMFFGESMFNTSTNASKVALLALCRGLHQRQFPLLDAQVASPHLLSLGAFQMPRTRFVAHVCDYCERPGVPGHWRDNWPTALASELG